MSPRRRSIGIQFGKPRAGGRARSGVTLLVTVIGMPVGLLLAAPAQAAQPAARPAVSASSVHTQRACARAARGQMACFALRRTDVTQPAPLQSAAVSPLATPSGYGPADLASAYKLGAGGAGQTVAIVDAYNDPTAENDLGMYRSQYGLPPCTKANGCFRQVNQNGATSPLPANNAGWAGEISLDLDMVSAICPSCNILLEEANSASDTNLYTAENRAVTMGAKFVSNSWGGGEYSGQTSDDSFFNHPGVAITVSSGDDGTGPEYPATSQYVTAVGGTHLTTASNSRGWAETAWSSAGSGCSAYDAKPSWQTVSTGSCTRRAEADVSAVADPATGVAVYQTYGAGGWVVYGGTSVSAPIVASVYALAGTPAAGSYPASFPYAHQANLFDVTSGSNGSCGAPICTAGAGWDGPTGLGSPNGTAAFSSGAGTGNTVTVTNPGNQTATVGTAFSLQIDASDSATGQTLSYSATGLPPGLSINATTGLISGTPSASGSSTVTVTAADTTAASGSATFGITVSGGAGCSAAQLLGNPGFESGTAPWSATAGVISANGSGEVAHGGTHFAWLDGYGRTHTDTLAQSVTIPAPCTHTTLTFWLHIDTAESTSTTAYDKLTVKAGSTTLATYSNLNHAAGYTQRSLALGAFAGQTVTLTFTGTEDSSLQTSFVVDDTAVRTS